MTQWWERSWRATPRSSESSRASSTYGSKKRCECPLPALAAWNESLSLRAQIIAECEAYCTKILELVDSDVLGVETEHIIDASQATKSTVGLMVSSARPRTYVPQSVGCQTDYGLRLRDTCMQVCLYNGHRDDVSHACAWHWLAGERLRGDQHAYWR